MTKKLLKIKGPDGKWQTVASYEIGQYGPRIGINKAVARSLLEGDGWANLSVFDDKPRDSASSPPATTSLDSIPF